MITADQYRHMSRHDRAMIMPRYYDTLLWLESIDRLSDHGKARLEKLRKARTIDTAVLA